MHYAGLGAIRSTARLTLAGALLLLPGLALGQSGSTNLAVGRVLIADKDLHDPNFEETVIVLLTYDDDGAGGVILNRPSEIPVSRALREIPEAQGNKDPAYEGGPMQTKRVLALLRATTKLEDADEVVPGIYSVGTTKLLRKALAEKMSIRVFAGYAGWGPGQLEAEVDAGAWHVERGRAATLFDDDPETLWPRLVRQLDRQIARAVKYRDAIFSIPSASARAGSMLVPGFLRQSSSTGSAGSCEGSCTDRSPASRQAVTPWRSSGHHRI